jgi:hypothetical protein
MKKKCTECQHKILLEEIYKMAKIVNHHGNETMDSCRFRETFAELCKSIVMKCEEIR